MFISKYFKYKRFNMLRKFQRALLFAGVCGFTCLRAFEMSVYANEGNLAKVQYATSYAVIDADTGRLLDGKDAMLPVPNASTTKILTCIVALENGTLTDVIVPSENACNQPKVRLGLNATDSYQFIDLVYCMMLESYNDCAVAIAEQVAGNVDAFCELMNQKAKELGCEDTCFLTPNGLDKTVGDNTHHTTAYDLCLLMKYCCFDSPKKDQFLEICQTKSYEFMSALGNHYTVTNKNPLLNNYEDMLSGKTGYTAKAGYCYVSAFETKESKRFCVALLGCGWPNHKNYRIEDTNTIYRYISDNYQKSDTLEYVPKLENEKCFGCFLPEENENLEFSRSCSVPLTYLKEAMPKVLAAKEDCIKVEECRFSADSKENILKNNRSVGVLKCYLNDEFIDAIPIEYSQKPEKWTLLKVLVFLIKKFCLFS